MMTTNVSESFNGVLRGARALPVKSLVARTFYRLNDYFMKRRSDAERFEMQMSPKIETL